MGWVRFVTKQCRARKYMHRMSRYIIWRTLSRQCGLLEETTDHLNFESRLAIDSGLFVQSQSNRLETCFSAEMKLAGPELFCRISKRAMHVIQSLSSRKSTRMVDCISDLTLTVQSFHASSSNQISFDLSLGRALSSDPRFDQED